MFLCVFCLSLYFSLPTSQPNNLKKQRYTAWNWESLFTQPTKSGLQLRSKAAGCECLNLLNLQRPHLPHHWPSHGKFLGTEGSAYGQGISQPCFSGHKDLGIWPTTVIKSGGFYVGFLKFMFRAAFYYDVIFFPPKARPPPSHLWWNVLIICSREMKASLIQVE